MAYTDEEIELMRSALRFKHQPASGVPYFKDELDAKIERDLQTHIINKTNPQDLASECGGRIVTIK